MWKKAIFRIPVYLFPPHLRVCNSRVVWSHRSRQKLRNARKLNVWSENSLLNATTLYKTIRYMNIQYLRLVQLIPSFFVTLYVIMIIVKLLIILTLASHLLLYLFYSFHYTLYFNIYINTRQMLCNLYYDTNINIISLPVYAASGTKMKVWGWGWKQEKSRKRSMRFPISWRVAETCWFSFQLSVAP